MAATALIRFTQNASPGTSGQAYIGTTGAVVTVTNAVNTDVASWKIELAYAPPGSSLAVVPGTFTTLATASNSTPTATFTPDVAGGSYRIVLTVYAGAGLTGQTNVDIRNFIVPTPRRSFIVPPYQKLPDPLPLPPSGEADAKPDEMNYGGQSFGWAGDSSQNGLHQILTTLDLGMTHSVGSVVTSSPTTIATGFSPRTIPVDTANISWPSSNGTINIPAGLPVGYVINVHDSTGSGQTKPITIAFLSGETAHGLSSFQLARNYGTASMVKISSTTWMLHGAKVIREERTLLAGLYTTGLVGFQAVGAASINPADYPNLISANFRALVETSNAADAVEVRLFNSTTAATISGSTLSSTSIQPALLSANVTLTSGANVYEIQIRLTTTGNPNQAACKQSQIVFTWLQP